MSEQSSPIRHAINWFEIPAVDFKRAVSFYSSVFNIQMFTTEMGPAQMAFFPMEQGSVGGAVVKQPDHQPSHHGARVYLNASGQFDEILARVPQAGGKVILPRTLVTEEIGYVAMFSDTEGNLVAIHASK